MRPGPAWRAARLVPEPDHRGISAGAPTPRDQGPSPATGLRWFVRAGMRGESGADPEGDRGGCGGDNGRAYCVNARGVSHALPRRGVAQIDAHDRSERWREHLSQGTSVTMLAETGGQLVGFAAFGKCRDEDLSSGAVGEVMAIYVHPAAWRRGVGSALLREAVDRLRSGGFAEVSLWVIEANRQAIAFYERFGFVRDGSFRHRRSWGFPRPSYDSGCVQV